MTKLDWPDIFIDARAIDIPSLAALWPRTLAGQFAPVGASVFGDCFFVRPEGQVERLDVLEGGLHRVADDFDGFRQRMNDPAWRQSELLTEGVALLHERGVLRTTGQFYGFAPHPCLLGRIDWARAMPLDGRVWHGICAQLLDAAVVQR